MSGALPASVQALDQHIPGGYPDSEAAAQQPVSSQRSLAEALHARRAEYTRPHTVKIKVGTWNVAAKSGTEKDVGGWFVGGKGVEEALTGLSLDTDGGEQDSNGAGEPPREGVEAQEQRRTKKSPTIPKNDPGSVPGDDEIDIYVLGLQEVIDITSPTQALRPYNDAAVPKKYKDALEAALPAGYELVSEQQLQGLLLLVYASGKIAPDIRSVSSTSVGTGLMGYMGNKGATSTRIVLGETTRIVFINSHLSSGVGKGELERRNWDSQQIISRTKFEPVVDTLGSPEAHGETIGDEDFAFWFGDLNYRLEGIPGDDVRRLLMLHTRNEYDLDTKARQAAEHTLARDIEASKQNPAASVRSDTDSVASYDIDNRQSMQSEATWETGHETLDPHDDPASLQTTLLSLLPHDELHQQQKLGRAFHDGWKEGPITFLPTYKYDCGSVGIFDSSEKRRAPSWCDRILFRTRTDRQEYHRQLKEEEDARQRDEYMKAQGINQAAEDEDTLFEYDPEADAEDAEEEAEVGATGLAPTTVTTKEGYEDILALQYYISHQRVLSSDHKPLDAIFSLKYDAVIPDLKGKVHQEVVKDLDRAENEGRPILTLALNNGRPIDKGVDFGEVRLGQPVVRQVTLANTGQVKAEFGLASRPIGGDDDFGSSEKWLATTFDIEPETRTRANRRNTQTAEDWSFNITESYTLDPGDTCNIELQIHINDNQLLKEFNQGQKIEDVLILRVRDGRDHFIPVHGTWLASSLGRDIDSMCRVPEGGIRKMASTPDEPESHAVIWSAPREVFRLTESIEKLTERVLAEWSMTNDDDDDERPPPWVSFAGWPFVVESLVSESSQRVTLMQQVREALDLDEELSRHLSPEAQAIAKIEAIGATLLQLLESLDDGVVPKNMWTRLDDEFFAKPASQPSESSADDDRARVLEILATSRNHSVTFVLLMSMLSHLVQELAGPQLTANPSLSRTDSELPASPKVVVRRKTLDADPLVARRQLVRKNLAAIFGPVLVRFSESVVGKSRALAEEHACSLVEMFLKGNTE